MQSDLFAPSCETEALPVEVLEAIKNPSAAFFCSVSGGKDSQAMYLKLRDLIPTERLFIVHADLGAVEWKGVQEHIRSHIDGKELHVVQAVDKDGNEKNLLGMVEKFAARNKEQGKIKAPWPSSAMRWCTSDLKRGPIEKIIRKIMKENDFTIGFNCTGIRADESTARAKKISFEVNKSLTIKTRTVYNWMPIFELSSAEVFDTIEDAGQKPFYVYGERGADNDRLSCVFCIMGSPKDLRHGAELNPELYRKYVQLEKDTGYTMFMSGKKQISLEEKTGIKVVNI